MVCIAYHRYIPQKNEVHSLQKKLLNCDGNCDEKFWNCDGKVQFVTEIVTESSLSQFHLSQIHLWRIRHNLWRKKVRHNFLWRKICDGNIPSQIVSDGNCDGLFPSQSKIVTDFPSQFPEEELDLGRIFVTDWVISVTILWRIPSLSVTICDGPLPFRHNLWRISVTIYFFDGIPSQIPSEQFKREKKPTIWGISAYVEC